MTIPDAHGTAPTPTPANGVIRRLFASLEGWHLNALAALVVAVFIGLQIHSMLFGTTSRRRRPLPDTSLTPAEGKAATRQGGVDVQTARRRADFVDKKVGDTLDVLDEHDDFSAREVREVPYRALNLSEGESQARSQLFYELMKVRRSVRRFSSRPVPLKLIQNLIKTAGTSPSGANLEPWTFCVVENEVLKRRVREVVEEQEKINYSRRMGAKWVLDLKHLNTNWNKPYIDEAPYIIIVMKHSYQVGADGSRQPTYYNEISASIAVGLLLAAIQNAGLVTVTTTPLNAGGEIRELLQRPENEKVLVLLPVGYPAEDAHVPDIGKRPLEDIIRIY